MDKETYKIMPVIKRLLNALYEKDKKQVSRTFFYTLTAGLYPFLGVLLPKIAIGILETGTADVAKQLLIAMVLYLLVAGVLGYVSTAISFQIESANMRMRLRYVGEMGKKCVDMDYKYVEDASFWDKNHRAMQACSSNNNGVEAIYHRVYKQPANIIAILIMVWLTAGLSPWILLALVAHVLVIMWTLKENHKYRYDRKEELAKQQRKMGYYYRTTHDFSFGKDIRIYNLRDRIVSNYENEIKAFTTLTKKLEQHEFLLSLAGIVTLLITNVLMYGILIYQAYQGMPISTFSMYVTLVTTLMAMMLKLAEDISFIQNEGQYVGDFFRFLDEDLCNENKPEITIDDTLEIVFDHVDFKYPGSETYIYKDLNFTIHKGESLAIVGVNGAGKSTLVKLMTGLFEPTAGHIFINGIDITEFRKKDLYKLYSAVFQDVNVLAFPIRNNVVGNESDVDDARVKEALEKVGLWKKVEGFEHGLDQMMLKVIDENGTDFSGGERQKLSIARGLYKDAPMVIMDEPTAALDALAEAEIYESFSSMVKGKTAVYVSHRLASTKFCDKIALFDKDGLKEYGTHEELMEKQGEYYHMFTVQGKYYQEGGEEECEN